MVKDSIHFFFRQERRVKIKFSPSQVTFCPTLSGVGSLFQGLMLRRTLTKTKLKREPSMTLLS